MKAEIRKDICFICSECFDDDPQCAGCRKFIQPECEDSCEVYCYGAIDGTHLCSCCQAEKEDKEKEQ